VYIAPNPRFRLPEDPDAAVMMIGAGTGVAPYRAFLEEREASGAGGRQLAVLRRPQLRLGLSLSGGVGRYRRDGLLTRHDVAFSRDQAEKVYVQDRIRERGARAVRMAGSGAHVYVCGDAKHMAPDVPRGPAGRHRTGSRRRPRRGRGVPGELKQSNRYQRDVY
jgi:sulfite reductase (NADPH) flavoprotein alpha-component